MKYLFTVMLFILLLITIWFYAENIKLERQVDQLLDELEVSKNYINQLKKQMSREQNITPSIISDEDKTQKLMDTYLEENSTQETEKTITNQYDEKRKFLPDLVPVKGEYALSQKFSKEHPAIDLAAATETEVITSAAGEVLSVYFDDHFGTVVMVDHQNEYATLYAHLAITFCEEKAYVEKGETIALVGNTGNSSAPHLHYEIMVDGKNVNPEKYIDVK